MPKVSKEQARNLLFNTLKTIQEKEKKGDDAPRLKELKEFEKALRSFVGKDFKEPTAREISSATLSGIHDDERGNIKLFTFPGWPPGSKTEPVSGPTPAAPTKETAPSPTPSAPQQPTRKTEGRVSPGTRTLARPGTMVRQEIDIPLNELRDYRRRLEGTQWRVRNLMQQTKDEEKLAKLSKERDKWDEIYNRTVALERQYYDEGKPKPDDWAGSQPKTVNRDEALKRKAVTLEQLPDALKETKVGTELFAREPGTVKKGELPPEKISKKFVNNEIRRLTNDLGRYRDDIEKLNPKRAGDRSKIENLHDKVDKTKNELRYFAELRPVGVENSRLTDEYRTLAKDLTGMLTPEQREAFKAGKEIDINKIPNSRGFLESLRELGRERDRIFQGLNDEIRYVNAVPGNKIADYRAMDPEERQDVLNEVKEREFMQNVLQGAPEFYDKQVGEKAAGEKPFDSLAPETQQDWIKKYAAQQVREGAPGMSGSDMLKWGFGGGQEFISKYPPELHRPMIRAAKQGLTGLGQSTRSLQQQLQQDPFEQIYGAQAAPNLRQLFLGVGPDQQQQPQGQPQQPQQQVPQQPPQPYEFPLQQEPALPNLRQMLSNEL